MDSEELIKIVVAEITEAQQELANLKEHLSPSEVLIELLDALAA